MEAGIKEWVATEREERRSCVPQEVDQKNKPIRAECEREDGATEKA